MKQWHATLSYLSSTAWGKVFLFVGCMLTDQKKHHSLICRTILFAYSTARKKSLMWTSTTTFMLGCIALEKTRCKKHGQAILFFHRNFSEGCAILVCDFHFSKNICKTVIVSISQKWVCDNRAVQNLREVSIFICRSDFLSSTWSFLLASTVIVQVQRYGSGLWK